MACACTMYLMDRDRVLANLHNQKVMVAERVATVPERSAWVGVYPLNPARETTRELLARGGIPRPKDDVNYYHVRAFELARSLHDTWFGEPDLQNKVDSVVAGDDALVAKLTELGVPIESLDRPWKTDYPL